MSNLIPIKLAEAALDAQAANLQKLQLTELKAYVSKATFDHTWLLYQLALEEAQQLKAQLQAKPISPAITLAKQLADLAVRKGFFYSRESQAQADEIIKQIKAL
jgi:hypothetical protein